MQKKQDVKLMIHVSGSPVRSVPWEVLYVPGLKYTLISVGTLSDNCMQASFDHFGVDVSLNGKIAHGKEFGKLHIWTTFSPTNARYMACIADLST